jgi:cyclopropane fatty-acyl-phospholipid synthase-like methyltransferase
VTSLNASHAEGLLSEAILRKNREIYSETSSPVWFLAIYGGVHSGWEFINLGGTAVLDRVAKHAELTTGDSALELCSGRGATCRYLAEKYGCRVTGVEMNSEQAAAARKNVSPQQTTAAERIEIVEADVLRYRARRLFDLVYSIDSAMLIADIPQLLCVARRALRPGSRVEIVTIGAGPDIDEPARSFAWEIDGMISLLTRKEWESRLVEAGFGEVSVEDLTQIATVRSLEIDAALDRYRDAIVAAEGEASHAGWVNVGKAYLSAFLNKRLAYFHVSGSAPSTRH